ncbi:MAG: HDOD domain-containing protein [bacterium]|nr:HDOD domain-containing protein [bacterium]
MPPALHAQTAPAPSTESPQLAPPAERTNQDRQFCFVGRQPILDRKGRVVAHDLLFRDSERATEASFDAPLAATVQVLLATFAELGPATLIGDQPAFVNADPTLEIAEHLAGLPKVPLIFDIPAGIEIDDTFLERIDLVRSAGFELCLDDYDYKDPREVLLPLVQYAKVDFSRHKSAALRKIARTLNEHQLVRVATRIETERGQRIFEQQEWHLALGYFFAHPEQVARARPSIRRSRMLELLGRIDDDTPAEEIAKQLKRVPHLTMNVLSMANLVRDDAAQRIESVEQAVVMVGRDRLMRWLHLLLFASDDPNGLADPLCQLSSTRSTLMERLARFSGQDDLNPDRAALAGLLSLAPALLGMSVKEVCRKLALEYSIEKALLRREGPVGELLALVECREEQDSVGIAENLAKLGLDWPDLERAALETIGWNQELSGLQTTGDRPVRLG